MSGSAVASSSFCPVRAASRKAVVEPEPLPHSGRVVVSEHSGAACVLNTVTLERQKLTAGQWQLAYDADGFAALANGSDETSDAILVEDYMRRTLGRTPEDPLVVTEVANGRRVTWSLSAKLNSYDEVTVATKCTAMRAERRHRVYKLAWPRDGFKFFWNAGDLYNILGLRTYGGGPGNWVWKSSTAWKQYLRSCGFTGIHLLPGIQERDFSFLGNARCPP